MPASATTEEEHTATGGNGSATGEPEQVLERSLAELSGAVRQIQILAGVRSERVRLRLRRTLARLHDRIYLGAAMVLLVSAGFVLVAIGLAGAFRALFAERPWLGELLAGAVLLAGALTWGFARRVLFERAELRRIEAKYGELESRKQRSGGPRKAPPSRGSARPG